MRQRVLDYAVYVAVRILIAVVQALPLDFCAAMCRQLAVLANDLLKIRRSVTDENLAFAYPQLSPSERHRLARRMWEHLFLMVVEVAHARRKIHTWNWQEHIRFVRAPELVRMMLDTRRPTILLTGHYGNFELAGFVLGLVGLPTFTVARPLDNPYLDRFLEKFRSGTGQQIIPKEGSSQQIATLLEQGAVLTLLGDQAAGPKGCWVTFFGRPASAHKAIAVFSLTSGGPLAVTYARRLDRPLKFETGMLALADPADPGYKLKTIPELTQWYSDQLEIIINEAPEQYWWLHRRWKGEPKRRAVRPSAA